MPRNMVLPGNEETAKDNIKLYFQFAKDHKLVDKLVTACQVKSVASLRWSYNSGRISQEQINGYKDVLGAEEKYLTGEEPMRDSKEIEHQYSTLNEVRNKESQHANTPINANDLDSLRNKILASHSIDELEKYKRYFEYLLNLIHTEIARLTIDD